MFLHMSRTIDRLNDAIADRVSWALLAAVLICSANALLRYAANRGSNAWLEIQWYLFAALFMLASAHTLRRDEHVRIDVLSARLTRRARAWLDLFGFIAFLMPVSLLIVYYGAPFAWLSLRGGEMSANAGGLPLWPVKLLVPLGFLLLALQGCSEIIKRVAFLAGKIDDSAFTRQSAPEHEAPAAARQSP